MPRHSKVPLMEAPDGGWGWMIVISCFLVTICTRGVSRCISIFFVEFQNYFAQDYAMTAWIHSTVDCTTMMFAPIGSIISNRYSTRVSVILGGVLASAGLILSSFATCLEYLYLSLGVLTGCGYALAYSPAISIVGQYFCKRKAMAYGLAMSGSGIGTFVLAPVVQLLIEQYSWRGALLILGGLVANICVCGALLRPLSLVEDLPSSTISNVASSKSSEECSYKTQCDDPQLPCPSVDSNFIRKDRGEKQPCGCCPSYKEYAFLLTSDFLVFAASLLFLAYGCSTPFVHLVPYAVSAGVSQQQAAFLMSILGIVNIIGNISFGWLTDRRRGEPIIQRAKTGGGVLSLSILTLMEEEALELAGQHGGRSPADGEARVSMQEGQSYAEVWTAGETSGRPAASEEEEISSKGALSYHSLASSTRSDTLMSVVEEVSQILLHFDHWDGWSLFSIHSHSEIFSTPCSLFSSLWIL
ncbi:monocarboxylate transporter 12-like isoform X4 [Heterodontus francisci]|uniref:monocarboxylate transporter 12-like isoform X4 n=1 Tax=Heterodontus francisci TaxID=7792 RepID=UPI00355BF683